MPEQEEIAIQDIIGKPPKGIIFWGGSVLFIIFSLFVLLSLLIKYPDQIQSTILITTKNPPIEIISKTSGRLHLYCDNESIIDQDATLAVIENTADYADVSLLKEQLTGFNIRISNKDSLFLDNIYLKEYSLGEIQFYFSNFLKDLRDYQVFSHLNYHEKNIKLVKNRIKKLKGIKWVKSKQLRAKKEIYELELNEYQRQLSLHEKEFVSDSKIEKQQTKLLAEQYKLESAKMELLNMEVLISELEGSILENDISKQERKERIERSLIESHKELITQIELWEEKYVLKSPIIGKVSLFEFKSNDQFVPSGSVILTVLPIDEKHLIGVMQVSTFGSGKIEANQSVNIRLANYPYEEYGLVLGVVNNISSIPMDNKYQVEIDLPQGLFTTYNKKLEFKQKLVGQAEIITKDMSLFQRMFNQFRKDV